MNIEQQMLRFSRCNREDFKIRIN